MTLLPIVERELRVAARRVGTYWSRLALALAAILIGTLVFVVTLRLPDDDSGFVLAAHAPLRMLAA